MNRPLVGLALGLPLVCLLIGGCGGARGPEAKVVDGQTYGTTTAPFRGRWWQYYERGVSWSLGGFWAEAEADFREALALRLTDNRRARTYGMHFVQCFLHRELGAVLIEQNRLDEAESELRLSLAQEPSAKADYLLARIATLRGVPVPVDAALVLPAEPAPQLPARVVIDAVQPGADNTVTVTGRFLAVSAQPLWVLNAAGEKRLVATAADGAFTVALTVGERLATSGATNDPVVLATPEPPPPAPSLDLDGPMDGALVTGNRVLFRYSAKAAAGLTALTVSIDGKEALNELISGVQAGGTIAVPLESGKHTLRFVLRLAGGDLVQERTVTAAPTPEQDRTLRATAVMLPLQTPADGGGVKPGDDPELLSSVSHDGRFRLVDAQADTLLAQELTLVDAGYVDRVTAARAGQRLKSRYVLTGTLRRGRGDVECFVRLVHVDSGQVVASADAYSRAVAPEQEQAFFALVAGRLRQEFPVLQGTLGTNDRGVAIVDRGENAGVVGRMRFFAVKREADVVDATTGQVLLPGEKRVEATVEVDQVEAHQARVKTIDGKTATGATVVSE
ncbi:MAG: hypothetical protein H0W78_18275 [Planctomycetes bacterium]|nr:hypothetical protein [Planctomycetota bacterium]